MVQQTPYEIWTEKRQSMSFYENVGYEVYETSSIIQAWTKISKM